MLVTATNLFSSILPLCCKPVKEEAFAVMTEHSSLLWGYKGKTYIYEPQQKAIPGYPNRMVACILHQGVTSLQAHCKPSAASVMKMVAYRSLKVTFQKSFHIKRQTDHFLAIYPHHPRLHHIMAKGPWHFPLPLKFSTTTYDIYGLP